MSAPIARLSSLRQLLAERFPRPERTGARRLTTGIPEVDEAAGGIPCGAVTEIVCAAPSCGSQLLVGELLRATREEHGRVALLDGADSFDPQSWPEDWLRHLVWVRCQDVAMALRAADLVTRDANFHLVILDLRHAPAGELRRTPASFWYRLQHSAEPSDLALVVLTPRATVASARLRLQLDRSPTFAAFETPRPELVRSLAPEVQRQRLIAAAG